MTDQGTRHNFGAELHQQKRSRGNLARRIHGDPKDWINDATETRQISNKGAVLLLLTADNECFAADAESSAADAAASAGRIFLKEGLGNRRMRMQPVLNL